METAVQVEPIEDTTFGAWVRGVDVRVLDEDTFTTIYDAWITFGLLIFPDQFLSKDLYIYIYIYDRFRKYSFTGINNQATCDIHRTEFLT